MSTSGTRPIQVHDLVKRWAGRVIETSRLTNYRWSVVEYKRQLARFPDVESGKVDVIPGSVMDADVEMSNCWEEFTDEKTVKLWESLMLWPKWETPNQVRGRVGFWGRRLRAISGESDTVGSHRTGLTARRRIMGRTKR